MAGDSVSCRLFLFHNISKFVYDIEQAKSHSEIAFDMSNFISDDDRLARKGEQGSEEEG